MTPCNGSEEIISAATHRLAAAKKWEASAAHMLKAARKEVRDAELFFEAMEKRCRAMEVNDGSVVQVQSTTTTNNNNRANINESDDGDMSSDDEDHDLEIENSSGNSSSNNNKHILSSACHVVVFGCGMHVINGDYRCCGTCDDVPMFCKDNFIIFRCMISDRTRRWFLSKVPEGVNPGTNQDVDFYTAHANDLDHLPPRNNWVVRNNEAGQIDREGSLVVVAYAQHHARGVHTNSHTTHAIH